MFPLKYHSEEILLKYAAETIQKYIDKYRDKPNQTAFHFDTVHRRFHITKLIFQRKNYPPLVIRAPLADDAADDVTRLLKTAERGDIQSEGFLLENATEVNKRDIDKYRDKPNQTAFHFDTVHRRFHITKLIFQRKNYPPLVIRAPLADDAADDVTRLLKTAERGDIQSEGFLLENATEVNKRDIDKYRDKPNQTAFHFDTVHRRFHITKLIFQRKNYPPLVIRAPLADDAADDVTRLLKTAERGDIQSEGFLLENATEVNKRDIDKYRDKPNQTAFHFDTVHRRFHITKLIFQRKNYPPLVIRAPLADDAADDVTRLLKTAERGDIQSEGFLLENATEVNKRDIDKYRDKPNQTAFHFDTVHRRFHITKLIFQRKNYPPLVIRAPLADDAADDVTRLLKTAERGDIQSEGFLLENATEVNKRDIDKYRDKPNQTAFHFDTVHRRFHITKLIFQRKNYPPLVIRAPLADDAADDVTRLLKTAERGDIQSEGFLLENATEVNKRDIDKYRDKPNQTAFHFDTVHRRFHITKLIFQRKNYPPLVIRAPLADDAADDVTRLLKTAERGDIQSEGFLLENATEVNKRDIDKYRDKPNQTAFHFDTVHRRFHITKLIFQRKNYPPLVIRAPLADDAADDVTRLLKTAERGDIQSEGFLLENATEVNKRDIDKYRDKPNQTAFHFDTVHRRFHITKLIFQRKNYPPLVIRAPLADDAADDVTRLLKTAERGDIQSEGFLLENATEVNKRDIDKYRDKPNQTAFHFDTVHRRFHITKLIFQRKNYPPLVIRAPLADDAADDVTRLLKTAERGDIQSEGFLLENATEVNKRDIDKYRDKPNQTAFHFDTVHRRFHITKLIFQRKNYPPLVIRAPLADDAADDVTRLLKTAERGDIQSEGFLLENATEVNKRDIDKYRDKPNQTAFHFDTVHRRFHITKLIFQRKNYPPLVIRAPLADDAADDVTRLLKTAERGDIQSEGFLLENATEVNKRDIDKYRDKPNQTAFHFDTVHRRFHITKLIFQRKNYPPLVIRAPLADDAADDVTRLLKTAERGDIQSEGFLLENATEVNKRDIDKYRDKPNQTALYYVTVKSLPHF